jgi:competence protein ComEA
MYGAFSSANYEVRPVSPPAPSAEEAPAVGRATPRAEAESAPREADSPAVINLNTATAEQLDTLPGVGPATAESILAYRKENGGFKSIDELLAVRGIGPKKLEKMRPFLAL